MEESTTETGKITKWRGGEFSLGRTEKGTKGNILMIKSMALGYLHGQMGEYMKEIGLMATRKAMGLIHLPLGKKDKENSRQENLKNGFNYYSN